jgi:predicted metalloprotease with PDZ domain
MKKLIGGTIILLLILMSNLILAAEGNTHSKLDYTISLINLAKSDNIKARILLNFPSVKGETVKLILPGGAAVSVEEMQKSISDINVKGGTLDEDKDTGGLTVHATDSNVTVTYDLAQSWKGPLGAHGSKNYLPVLQGTYLFLPGDFSFIYPEWFKNKSVEITMKWHLPKDWKIFNSFGEGNKKQVFKANKTDFTMGRYFAGSDFTFYKRYAKGGEIFVATRGKWSFDTKEFADNSFKIIEDERKFMDDYSTPFFLVNLLPLVDSTSSFGGEGGTNVFTVYMPSNFTLSKKIFWLITHECFHHWNMPDFFNLDEYSEVELYWFTEGFTEYFAHLVDLETGIWNHKDYVANYNRTLLLYYYSEFATLTNKVMGAKYWTTPGNFHFMPYFRGEILAHNWNIKIKKESNGEKDFSDMFKEIISLYKKDGKLITYQDIYKISKKYIKGGVKTDIKKYIVDGKLMMPNFETFGNSYKLETKQLVPFELGFNLAKSEMSRVISGVINESNAYKAGLRDGQKFISCDIDKTLIKSMFVYDYSYLKNKVNVVIGENGEKRKISYLPYSGELKPVPQFVKRN